MADRDKIVTEFNRIKSLGFIKSNRTHDTGIGKTFEDYLGVSENNDKDPDFEGFEVKSQRQLSSSYLTLFTKSPSSPKGANSKLKDTFGKPDEKFPDIKVLHSSLFANRYNTYIEKFRFKLIVNREEEKVFFSAKPIDSDNELSGDVYWTFEDLNNCIDSKLKSLFVVTAETKHENGHEYFHYTKAIVYNDPEFEKFLQALENGIIMFDFRIGAYKTPGRANFGKPHDHGSGYRIKRENLSILYSEFFEVE